VRTKIAAEMIRICEQYGNEEQAEFWRYILRGLDILKDPGMSDEEDGTEEIIVNGVVTEREVRMVKNLWFRHESFREVFQIVDGTRETETMIFSQAGRARIPRKRVEDLDLRQPPVGMPRSMFREEYLDRLLDFEIDDLEFSTEEFHIRESREFNIGE
jgi:hypothetical protein